MRWMRRSAGGVPFTDEARAILARARAEAHRLGHGYVGTEHLLLGLVGGPAEDAGVRLLAAQGVSVAEVVEALESAVRRGTGTGGQVELPYTGRAKRVLEYALKSGSQSTPRQVGSEQILVGILLEERGIAAQVLTRLGASVERTRAAAEAAAAALAGDETAEPAPAFRISIDDASSQSIYQQIVAQVQEAVATGVLGTGDRLPPVRRLADELDIAPGTVARAYGELERMGVVVTEGARGTRVASPDSEAPPHRGDRESLAGLLRPVAVAAFHMGLGADDLRAALETAMKGIFDAGESPGRG